MTSAICSTGKCYMDAQDAANAFKNFTKAKDMVITDLSALLKLQGKEFDSQVDVDVATNLLNCHALGVFG